MLRIFPVLSLSYAVYIIVAVLALSFVCASVRVSFKNRRLTILQNRLLP